MIQATRRLTGQRRNPLRSIVVACVLVLLAAQGLIGALSLSALNRLAHQNTYERVSLVTRQVANDIQAGLNLGKPLAQYFGLSRHLEELQARLPGVLSVRLVLDQSQVVGTRASTQVTGGVAVSAALHDRYGVAGSLQVVAMPEGVGLRALLTKNLAVLGLTTGLALLVLVFVFRFLMPVHQLAVAGRQRLAAPLCVMLLAQGAYAAYTIDSFRSEWLQVARENAELLGQRLQGDLDRVLGYGVAPDRLVGVEKPLARQATAFPLIGKLVIADADGRPLFAADSQGAVPVADVGTTLDDDEHAVRFALGGADRSSGQQAWLYILLDQQRINQGVWQRIVDAGTVVVVALVATLELMLLLALLMDRAFAAPVRTADGPEGLDDISRIGNVVRPVMFGFMFAVAMPLSFIPLYARSLLEVASDNVSAVQMALPVAVEMGCGLLTALLAGRLIDRRGWPLPVLAGLVVSASGGLLAAAAGSLLPFVAARALVGLGYGLTWMGLQGFIVVASPASERGRNMASVIAGLFAGHLSGAAVGALLVEQAGSVGVFLASAGMLSLPAIGVATLMWPYRSVGRRVVPIELPVLAHSWKQACRLLFSRDYGLLLAGSIIPFSIAQVGLLSFALPLYMEQAQASTASTGRVLMAYGLCVIYISPWVARLADRSRSRKPWIVAGGLLGSSGLFALCIASNVFVATLAVVLLALASCLAGGAQAAYMLSLQRVQSYGAASATSLMRASDKLGQMAGPLLVGATLGFVGIAGSLAMVGAVYLLATLAFCFWAPSDQARVSV